MNKDTKCKRCDHVLEAHDSIVGRCRQRIPSSTCWFTCDCGEFTPADLSLGETREHLSRKASYYAGRLIVTMLAYNIRVGIFVGLLWWWPYAAAVYAFIDVTWMLRPAECDRCRAHESPR